jgi:hypothetical protein
VRAGFVAAWLAGTGLLVWRQVHRDHRLPVPGQMVAVTGFFAGLALVADVVPASAGLVTMTAWGLDLAGLLNLWPQGLGGEVQESVTAGTQK